MPMIVMTTSNSTKVKPILCERRLIGMTIGSWSITAEDTEDTESSSVFLGILRGFICLAYFRFRQA